MRRLLLATAILLPAMTTNGPKWEPLASRMADGRWAGTATRLDDGRVLVAGGYSYAKKDTVRSADLFDPRTRTFTPAAPMTTDRNFATATLLPGGKVLV